MRRVSMIVRAHLIAGLCSVALSLTALSAQAVLIPVLGGQAVYDAHFDITWVANANLAQTQQFGLAQHPHPISTDLYPIGSDGSMTWDNAHLWIAAMNTAGYLGASDWRLPITQQPDTSCASLSGDDPPQGYGAGCTGSEMGHLYNVEGVTSSSMGPFFNVQANRYWSGTTAPDPDYAWFFGFNGEEQYNQVKGNAGPAFAVRDGDIRLIPEPSTALLLAAGLAGLAMAGRRRLLTSSCR
jgi:hypothetical protein